MRTEPRHSKHEMTDFVNVRWWPLRTVILSGFERSMVRSNPGSAHNESLVRVAGGYEFEIGSAAITPILAVDSVDGELIYVAG